MTAGVVLLLLALIVAIPFAILYSGWFALIVPGTLATLSVGYLLLVAAADIVSSRRWAYGSAGLLAAWLLAWLRMEQGIHGQSYVEANAYGASALVFQMGLVALIGAIPIGMRLASRKETEEGASRREPLLLLGAYTVAIALLAGILTGFMKPPSTHSDETLIAHFHDHQADLETLVQMAEQDFRVRRVGWQCVGPDFDPRDRELGLTLPETRWNEYQSVLPSAGIIRVCRRDTGIWLAQREWRALFARPSKGFVYSLEEVRPLVGAVDRNPSPGRGVFRPIAPNWYLYAETGLLDLD
jgi:hypothetical protein